MSKSLKVFNGGINRNVFNAFIKSKTLFYILIVFVTIILSGCQSSPNKVITVYQSKYNDIDRTCEALQASLKSNGFNCKGVLDLNRSMANHGFQLNRTARVVQFGKTKYAHDIVMATPEASVLMPCAFGVYEDNGIVYISSLDRGLIGQMFGGTTEKIMGEYVAPDQSKVLNDCIEYKRLDIQTETTDTFWFNE